MKQNPRRQARILVFKIIYQRSKIGISRIGEELLSKNSPLPSKEREFARRIIDHTWDNLEVIDKAIQSRLKSSWKQQRLDNSLNTILRIGYAELCTLEEKGHKVVINEMLEICKKYCEANALKICNAILDRLWKEDLQNRKNHPLEESKEELTTV